jgi:hypothetical protein
VTRWLAERSGGVHPDAGDFDWLAKAPFELRRVDAFCRGRVCIAGDAAHSAGPTAAHSMNRGFAEIEDLIRARDEGAEAVAAAETGMRGAWDRVFGLAPSGAPPVAPEAGWPKSWIDTIPASGPDLEVWLERVSPPGPG